MEQKDLFTAFYREEGTGTAGRERGDREGWVEGKGKGIERQ